MEVVVINTGTELLLGDVLNTHLAFIARELLPLGVRVARQVTVPDGDAIRTALLCAFADSDLVIVTGGLGPTTDDLTREITAELLGLELRHDATVMAAITARAAARGFRLTDRIPRQANIPVGGEVLANDHGTAPGIYLPPVERDGRFSPHVVLLPGPPSELRPMFRSTVVPLVRRLLPKALELEWRHFRLTGLGESLVEEAVGAELLAVPGLEVGYCARAGEVEVRLAGTAAAIALAEAIVTHKLGPHIFATDESSLAEVVVRLLRDQTKTVAVAESCTGGFLASRLTDVPGASAAFLAGYVTYANEAKIDLLAVAPALLAEHGAVSEQVAQAMAKGARERAGSDYALATTGVAGPGGGSEAKPVGTVFIALACRGSEVSVRQFFFLTDRTSFKQLTSQAALEMLRQRLTSEGPTTCR